MSDYLKQIVQATQRTKERQSSLSNILRLLAPEQPTLTPGAPPVARPVGAPPAPRPAGKGGVDDWISQALGVLKLDDSYRAGIRNMIMKESSGNPRAINNWDSNAKRGTPSKGLMQTIDPTFRAHALPGYDKDIYDPVSNIIAGIRYAQKRYGDQMLKQGGRKSANGKYKGY